MTNEHDFKTEIQEILSANSQQRTDYFVEQVKHHQQVWILNDEDGAVMLTADDEDCIPVWPNQYSAELWRNEEWASCAATPISIATWLARWTKGMQNDDLSVAVFPIPGEDGLVVSADEFEQMLGGS